MQEYQKKYHDNRELLSRFVRRNQWGIRATADPDSQKKILINSIVMILLNVLLKRLKTMEQIHQRIANTLA